MPEHNHATSGAASEQTRSPVLVLWDDILLAPERIAPERTPEIRKLMSDVSIVSVSSPTNGLFSTDIVHRTIRAPTIGLNALWAASYTYALTYQAYVRAQKSGKLVWTPAEDAPAGLALRLHEWSLRCIADKRLDPWPAEFPKPERPMYWGSPEHLATELFLVATGWVLLHELAHILRDHTRDEKCAPEALLKQEEREADQFATEWTMSCVSSDAERQKRALGITIATIFLVAHELMSQPRENRSHPPAHERLHQNLGRCGLLEDSLVFAFATAMLQMHFAWKELVLELPKGEQFSSLLDACCFALARRPA